MPSKIKMMGAALPLAFALTACAGGQSSDYQAPVVTETVTAEAPVDEAEGDGDTLADGETEAPSEDVGSQGTVANPLPYGSKGTVGDWELSVDAVNFTDANAILEDSNLFNSPSEQGQYVIVTVTGTYSGTEIGTLSGDLTLNYVGANSLLYGQSYATAPNDASGLPQVLTGGTVTGEFTFDVPPEAIGTGTVSVSLYGEDPVIWSGQ